MTGLSLTLRSEYRKFVTTRLWWILLLLMAGYMAFLGAVLAATVSSSAEISTGMGDGVVVDLTTPENVRNTVYGIAASVGYVFPLLIGTLSMTNEFRHKTITPTFLAVPRRGNVLLAKMISALPIGFFYGLAATAALSVAGATVLAITGQPTLLGDGETIAVLARSVLSLTLWAPIGVALGSIMTNQVVAIIVVLVYTQFVEAILRVLLGLMGDIGQAVGAFLPGAAGESVVGGSFFTVADIGTTIPSAVAILVMLTYAAGLALVGWRTTLRRDVS